jgi:hypothetical protein
MLRLQIESSQRTTGVNFINVLLEDFARRSKKRKKADSLTLFFSLLGSWCVKVCKMLMKLTKGVNFINFLRAAFTRSYPKWAKKQSSHQCLFALLGSIRAKAGVKWWWNSHLVSLTIGGGYVPTFHEYGLQNRK